MYQNYSRGRKQYICTFDIETIPDYEAAKLVLSQQNIEEATNYLKSSNQSADEKDITKIALNIYHNKFATNIDEKVKDVFYKPVFHKIIAISAVITEVNSQNGQFDVVKIGTFGTNNDCSCPDEKSSIAAFAEYVNNKVASCERYEKNLPLTLVTFNGRSFDIPVLLYRAMKHGISLKALSLTAGKTNYTYRYSVGNNTDLLDVLTNFGSSSRISLADVCSMLNIPVKTSVSGADVADLYKENKITEIQQYCEQDALVTYLLYLRYKIMDGTFDSSFYNQHIADLKLYIEKEGSELLRDVIEGITELN